MAYKVSSPRAGVASYSLGIYYHLKSYTTSSPPNQDSLIELRNRVPKFTAEFESVFTHGPGRVLVWLSSGLTYATLDPKDSHSPSNISAARRMERLNQQQTGNPFSPIVSQTVSSVPANKLGENATVHHTFSIDATVELLNGLNSEWVRTKKALLLDRVNMDNRTAIDFDDAQKTNFFDLISALRFIVTGSYCLLLFKGFDNIRVTVNRQYLATIPNITFSQLLMTGNVDPLILSICNDLTPDKMVVTAPLEPNQFINIPDHDNVQMFIALRQPGCVTETRLKLSGGIFLSPTSKQVDPSQARDVVRATIAKYVNTPIEQEDEIISPLPSSTPLGAINKIDPMVDDVSTEGGVSNSLDNMFGN